MRSDEAAAVAGALEALRAWGAAWDRLDLGGQIERMHFPHVRLNAGRFARWETSADFAKEWQPPPPEERFGGTVQENVRVVQAGPTKVHLAIRMSCRNTEGAEYNVFETLWIFALLGGKWGVQFRSSFLDQVAAAADGAGAMPAAAATAAAAGRLRLQDLRFIGFDLDHTIARYHLPALFELVHTSLALALCRLGHYTLAQLIGAEHATPAADYRANGSIIAKGVVFDARTGDLLKLGADGRVLAVSSKALSFCCASTAFLSKTVPFRAVPLDQAQHGLRRPPLSAAEIAERYGGAPWEHLVRQRSCF
eukprot:SAG22_NODE_225_length_14728_cov_58.742361_2_plen_308_part_00